MKRYIERIERELRCDGGRTKRWSIKIEEQ
jgi:hypothetical protein